MTKLAAKLILFALCFFIFITPLIETLFYFLTLFDLEVALINAKDNCAVAFVDPYFLENFDVLDPNATSEIPIALWEEGFERSVKDTLAVNLKMLVSGSNLIPSPANRKYNNIKIEELRVSDNKGYITVSTIYRYKVPLMQRLNASGAIGDIEIRRNKIVDLKLALMRVL